MEEEKKPFGRRIVNCIVIVAILLCFLSSIGFAILRSGNDGEEVASGSKAPTEVVSEDLTPEDTPLPSGTQEPTKTPKPTTNMAVPQITTSVTPIPPSISSSSFLPSSLCKPEYEKHNKYRIYQEINKKAGILLLIFTKH